MNISNTLDFFKFKPLKVAKVSEISEATLLSDLEPSERINFHIGNPVQDERLSKLYFNLVTNFQSSSDNNQNSGFKEILSGLSEENDLRDYHSFIKNCINKCSPYMPRGGYARNNIPELVNLVKEWLTIQQQEPLQYNFLDKGGQREVIFSNGGIWEDLRILFFSISKYLINLPAEILLFDITLPKYLKKFDSLEFLSLPDNEENALQTIKNIYKTKTEKPVFLILGKIANENTRRELREISLEFPLFFIEVNNAPNHLSMQREAKMLNRVLRIITPETISPYLTESSVNLIAGNAEFIKIFESVQFELKGTPAVTEVELLTYMLNNSLSDKRNDLNDAAKNHFDHSTGLNAAAKSLLENAQNITEKIYNGFQAKSKIIEKSVDTLSRHSQAINDKIQNLSVVTKVVSDNLTGLNNEEITKYFFTNLDNPEISKEIENHFLSVFLNHHPEYELKNCFVSSGSARTALSILGYHCNIKEVISVDLSWTYEHCFPQVEIVSLNDDLTLDVNKILSTVQEKVSRDQEWKNYGAVVLNNPHNASGQIFSEEQVSNLLQKLLENDIFVIDDLSYQNVLPQPAMNGPKTLRQLANQLTSLGYLSSEKINKLITVHSLSKTDCFAGARLAVVDIPYPKTRTLFRNVVSQIKPNIMAIFLASLFYRNHPDLVQEYWLLRNKIFFERMQTLINASENLPKERNPFEIEIKRPLGSMYPHMIINKLPNGISLNWLSSSLAKNGIGLVPLTTFARTAKGFELARKTFRLTLGGKADELNRKTRRVLIDLNRVIADEQANYNRINLKLSKKYIKSTSHFIDIDEKWNQLSQNFNSVSTKFFNKRYKLLSNLSESEKYINECKGSYLPERLKTFKQRLKDRVELAENILAISNSNNSNQLVNILQTELYKDNIKDRESRFNHRLFDRTVHPTQMYSLQSDLVFNTIIDHIIYNGHVNKELIESAIKNLTDEYFGLNVAINSVQEADELVADLKMTIMAEEFTRWNGQMSSMAFLSFWGDWDGSTRPSGQGHRLVMAVLLENITQMAEMLTAVLAHDTSLKIDTNLLNEIRNLHLHKNKFWRLSNKITFLTNELEKRILGVLPLDEKISRVHKIGQKFGLVKDDFSALWQHNDRLEQKMLNLRLQRKKSMEYYFALNKRLRKTLYNLLPKIKKSLPYEEIALKFGSYRDLLKRFALTPRIHQKIITSNDQFTINTTVQNILEINRISGEYGNPGMVLALQVSMTTQPHAIINLDRKIRSQFEQNNRNNLNANVPVLRLIPLFEDRKTVKDLHPFLDRLWEYSLQSRRIDQETNERFAELIAEIFIAGSDLSQQIGQPASLALFKEAKFRAVHWLTDRGLIEMVRIKLGSGEPMQRQGGYYEPLSGKSAFIESKGMQKFVKEAAFTSTKYAKSPLRGVFSSGDLRTFQSTISEKLRMIPMEEYANLLHHIKESQIYHRNEIYRASEPLMNTRLQYQKQGLQELQRITCGKKDEIYTQFLEISTRNFRDILYGRDQDVVGIHIISYFISRSMPTLRDRPTIRPSREIDQSHGQKIIEKIARTLPLSQYGSLLRAIGHNRSQSMLLGLNQLSTGLFRSIFEFINMQGNFSDGITLISDRVLPKLPVHDILHTIRIYNDTDLFYLQKMEKAFAAGNTSFTLLREDNDSINRFIGLLQKELLRRHGLDVNDFFIGDRIIPQLLPMLRPDLVVLLQPDLFNTNINSLPVKINRQINTDWFDQVEALLNIPKKIKKWRAEIWKSFQNKIFQQVESFVHLALAINKVYKGKGSNEMVFSTEPSKVMRLSSDIADMLRKNKDDSMRQFLIAAVQYLTQLPKTMSEIPIDIIRALRDVEKIIKIEEQAFSKQEQDLLQFYILKIARLCGENG